jgi:hypothetical protein
MSTYCLIADQIVQIADDRIGRLLFEFTVPEEQVDIRRLVCTVYTPGITGIHGVRSLTFAHPVGRMFAYDLDPFAFLAADEDYSHLTVINRREDRLVETMLAGIYSRLIREKTLFVHGALIDVPGFGGVMFIGKSGVGKTTQAMLWEKYRGAEIINGDKVYLGLRDDAPGMVMAYGSPWKGSSPYCVNKRVPLRAIVSLLRDETSAIRPLDEVESMAAYVPRVFMPGWDELLTAAVMDTINEMLPMVPVYEMSCRPDETAVEMLERAVMGRA